MISPVIVAIRPAGVTARCIHPGCGEPHHLYSGDKTRRAERAADEHLKAIRAKEAR